MSLTTTVVLWPRDPVDPAGGGRADVGAPVGGRAGTGAARSREASARQPRPVRARRPRWATVGCGGDARGRLAAGRRARHHGAVDGSASSDPVFGVLLVLHVLAAVVGFGALVVSGIQGLLLARAADAARVDALRRFFRPGVNWAARAVYLVPVLGASLVADGRRQYNFGDAFVVTGLALWAATVLLAEAVLWPAERRVQAALHPGDGGRREGAGADPVAGPPAEPLPDGTRRAARRLAVGAPVVALLFLLAVGVMVARP